MEYRARTSSGGTGEEYGRREEVQWSDHLEAFSPRPGESAWCTIGGTRRDINGVRSGGFFTQLSEVKTWINHGSHCWTTILVPSDVVNTLRPRQNGRRFADDTFKRIFLNENVRISIKISLKFVPKGPINNIPALVQIMAWRRSGDKPLSEPMMVSLLMHICVTRPQWVKSLQVIWRSENRRWNLQVSCLQMSCNDFI